MRTVPYAEFECLEALLPEVAALGDGQHGGEERVHLREGRRSQLGGGPRDVPPGDHLVEALHYAHLKWEKLDLSQTQRYLRVVT